ncbi:hypothetical protein TNCV_5050791 [Trichonephila clavipes]|nr:hypothetical protein TNCV_5050791 [Trichonephila clavipes]
MNYTHTLWNKEEQSFIATVALVKNIGRDKNNKQKSLSKGYGHPLFIFNTKLSSRGKGCHYSRNIYFICLTSSEGYDLAARRLAKASYTCSMGLKSGKPSGQSTLHMSSLSRSFSTAEDLNGRVQSSTKIKSTPMAQKKRRKRMAG